MGQRYFTEKLHPRVRFPAPPDVGKADQMKGNRWMKETELQQLGLLEGKDDDVVDGSKLIGNSTLRQLAIFMETWIACLL
jgi:hypothetical protein